MADDSAPKPGHFLPGGAGDAPKTDAANSGPANPETPKPGHFLPGGAGVAPTPERKTTVPTESAPLTAPTPRIGSGANAPAGPPQLSGSRLGPPPPGDPAAAAYKARFSPDPVPYLPRKKSKGLIAAIVVGALLVVGGGVAAAAKLLSSFDDIVANPMGTPSLRDTQSPADDPATTEPTSTPTPDVVVARENKLYAVGKLAPANCKEPAYRPTSKENVRSYYQVLLTCLNKVWEPVVKKAGYDFHPPKLIIFDDGQETACGVQKEVSAYCDADGGSVAMPWQHLVDDYPKNKPLIRIDLADDLGYVYGVHVQQLTGIFDAGTNLSDAAPNPTAKLEQDRRQALQAACLSAVFLGADKAAFPIQGELLRWWQWRTKHNGDESSPDKVRDHGSTKSVELWTTRGFATADPGSCNTFTAAANKVS